MTGFLNLTEVAGKRKTMIPIFWNHGLNLMMLLRTGSFLFLCKKTHDKEQVLFSKVYSNWHLEMDGFELEKVQKVLYTNSETGKSITISETKK